MSNGRKAIPPGPPWGKANGCSAMTSLVRRRVVLSFSRDLEFATETELAKRMGCQKHYWLRATLKELIDNARYTRRRAPEVEFPREGFARAIEDGGDETADRLRRQVDQLLNNGESAP